MSHWHGALLRLVLLGCYLWQRVIGVRICSAWSSVSKPWCGEFDVGALSGDFTAIVGKSSCKPFLYTHFSSSHLDILPHFVNHYAALGVQRDCFLLLWNTPPNSSADTERDAHAFFAALGVGVVQWRGVFTSAAAHYNKISLLHSVQRSQWVVYADVDEFAELGGDTVQARIAVLETHAYTHQSAITVDRVAADGRLVNIRSAPGLALQYPQRCSFTAAHGRADKIVFLRGDLRTSSGNHIVISDRIFQLNNQSAPSHGVERRASPCIVTLSHYKWTADVVVYLQQRIALYKTMAQYWGLTSSLLNSLRKNNWTVDINTYCGESVAIPGNQKPECAASIV